ncbi:hypothetical protein Lal_00007140 [Lupinus albus]|nr:hypothetical protein Lal_00007140 [Lupinus albus]
MLFVSHDRHFLSALSNRVLELTPDGIHQYGGGYTEYVERTGQEAPGVRGFGTHILFALIVASLTKPAMAETVVEGPVQAEVIRVVDGDTILVSAKPWPQQSIEVFVRLRGIDTPELKSRCDMGRQAAEAARDALESMIADTPEIKLTHISADKYFGRIVADVALEDGTNPATKLLAAGLGARYSGHGRKPPPCSGGFRSGHRRRPDRQASRCHQSSEIVLGNLAQDTAHDLAGTGRRELDLVRRSDRPDFGRTCLISSWRRYPYPHARHQRHVAIDALALDGMRVADNGRFGNQIVRDQRRFHFRRAKRNSRLRHAASIAGEILALVGGEVGLHEALVIAVDAAHLARPAVGDAEIAVCRTFQHIAFIVHQLRLDTEEGQGGGAGLQIRGAGKRRDHVAAGFRLPPGIDDGATLVTYTVDRLSNRAKQAQTGAGRACDELVASPIMSGWPSVPCRRY